MKPSFLTMTVISLLLLYPGQTSLAQEQPRANFETCFKNANAQMTAHKDTIVKVISVYPAKSINNCEYWSDDYFKSIGENEGFDVTTLIDKKVLEQMPDDAFTNPSRIWTLTVEVHSSDGSIYQATAQMVSGKAYWIRQ